MNLLLTMSSRNADYLVPLTLLEVSWLTSSVLRTPFSEEESLLLNVLKSEFSSDFLPEAV